MKNSDDNYKEKEAIYKDRDGSVQRTKGEVYGCWRRSRIFIQRRSIPRSGDPTLSANHRMRYMIPPTLDVRSSLYLAKNYQQYCGSSPVQDTTVVVCMARPKMPSRCRYCRRGIFRRSQQDGRATPAADEHGYCLDSWVEYITL